MVNRTISPMNPFRSWRTIFTEMSPRILLTPHWVRKCHHESLDQTLTDVSQKGRDLLYQQFVQCGAAVPHILAGPVGRAGALLDQRSKSPPAADVHVLVCYWMKPPRWGDPLWLWLPPSEGAHINTAVTAQAWRLHWQQDFLPFSKLSASPNNLSRNKWTFLPSAHPGN